MKANHPAAHAAITSTRPRRQHGVADVCRAAFETLEGRRLLAGDDPTPPDEPTIVNPPADPPAPTPWFDIAELIRLDEWVEMQEPAVLPSDDGDGDDNGEDTDGDGTEDDTDGGASDTGDDDTGDDDTPTDDTPADDPTTPPEAPPTTTPVILGAGHAVAIIDSGIDYTHPDLGGGFGDGFKVVGGYDFVDEDDDPMDTDGHGTAVAG
ncbi:MAG: S8 family serine peptidase, partial [Planctomycetota bacterium]